MTTPRLPLLLALAALVAPACYAGDDDASAQPDLADPAADPAADPELDPDQAEPEADPAAPEADPADLLLGIDAEFHAAAEEFDVPVQILQAVGFAETRWQMVEGLAEFDGQEPAYGVMALRGANLERGAELLGVPPEAVMRERPTNIRAAAALLSELVDEPAIDRKALGAWAPAVAALSEIAVDEALAGYVHHDVYGAIRGGVVVTDSAGGVVASLAHDATVVPDFHLPPPELPASGPDYAGSVWRPSPNYSARSAGTVGQVKMVIIHTCEGAYSGCWGWLVNPQAGVSAHYVVKEDGSEISQLVKESNKAWHIGASYDCDLNGGKNCGLNGYNANNFTVGIEHAGFAKQAAWNSNLINQSAKLVCDITKAHGVVRDKYHIVAHGKLQPYNRIDPGPNWPWTTYLNKVGEFCGAQPEPEPQPQPQPGGAIVVDSNNANNDPAKAKLTVSGNWTSSASTSGFYGSGYWFAATEAVSDGAEFSFYLPAAATKTVDAWWTAGTNRSSAAPFVVFDADGAKLGTVKANQQTSGSKWVELGKFQFKAGWNKVVLSRWAAEGSVVIADAVRIR